MMTFEEVAVTLATGKQRNLCAAGHPKHKRVWHGDTLIYDWETYDGTVGYCPGNDEVSKSVAVNGMWERFGMALTEQICQKPGVMIDVGAHIGLYSRTAALLGCKVLAVDADEENLRLLTENCAGLPVQWIAGWVGPDTPEVEGMWVRLLKVDIEGAEDQAVRVFRPLFADGLVDYALMEISPILAGHYPDTVGQILDCGYAGFLVPDLDAEWDEFVVDPLAFTMRHEFPVELVGGLRQRDMLFVRKDTE